MSKPLAVLITVIALLVLADVGIVAVRLSSSHPGSHAPVSAASGSSGHPCNHGWYVSQAAHAHKGGGYVSSVGKSKLGKNGGCAATHASDD